MYNAAQNNPLVHHGLQQPAIAESSQAPAANTFAQGAPPPLNLFPPGSLPPTAALSALFNTPQQQLPFQAVNNPLPSNFPLPPWITQAAGQTPAFGLQPQQQQQQQQQQQRPLLSHPQLQDDVQLRLRQQQQDFNANQFQQPYSSMNSRGGQQNQQRSKLREPYLRVKNLSRKYSYRDVKLLFADYKLRLEDIKMINDQNGERTGNSFVLSFIYLSFNPMFLI